MGSPVHRSAVHPHLEERACPVSELTRALHLSADRKRAPAGPVLGRRRPVERPVKETSLRKLTYGPDAPGPGVRGPAAVDACRQLLPQPPPPPQDDPHECPPHEWPPQECPP